MTSEIYPWALTKDAGSRSIDLAPGNVIQITSQFAYHKAYPLYQDLFAHPIKDIKPFDNPLFEMLGNSQPEIDRWYATSRRGPNAFTLADQADPAFTTAPDLPHTKSHQIRQFGVAKRQYRANLKAAADVGQDFSIRKEYRQRLDEYLKMEIVFTSLLICFRR